MIQTREIAPLALLVFTGCQVAAPTPSGAPGPIAPSVLSRFDLETPQEVAPLEPVHVLGASPAADEEGIDAPAASIEFEDVLTSVERHFPLVLAAQEEVAIAEGRLTAARGGFDTSLKANGLTELEGFYESDRFKLNLVQPIRDFGATFRGGYKLGRGTFADYDGEEQSNRDGELSAGVTLPLLQGRAIDPRRVALWRARIERQAADPFVLAKRLEAMRKAADAYWEWVAAGRQREVAVRLLALAEGRRQQITLAVEEGLLARINLTENQRLIVDRQSDRIRAEQKLRETAIKLSLFWRDSQGMPRVPGDDALPYEFPVPHVAEDVILTEDEAFALRHRPEVRSIQLAMERLELDGDLARNALLPTLDFDFFASQDYGEAASTPDDKGDLELTAMVTLDVPLQRRKAKGKLRELESKLVKLEREAQFVSEVIVTEIQQARTALIQSWERIAQAEENVTLANELAEAERFQLGLGQSDLLRVNLREQQAAEAAAELIKVLQEYFIALTTYRAVLGIPHDNAQDG